jgi:hypothetical protein
MSRCSRRGFLAGLLGVLASWLGWKARPGEAAVPSPAPPAAGWTMGTCDPPGYVTTCIYDCTGTTLSIRHGAAGPVPSGTVTTYCYDSEFGSYWVEPPPPAPPRQEPPPGSTDGPPLA